MCGGLLGWFVIDHLTMKSCLVSLYAGLFKMLLPVDAIIHSKIVKYDKILGRKGTNRHWTLLQVM